jgi:hypothetical protein
MYYETACFVLYLRTEEQPETFAESESESYVTTDSQPASLSWSKAPIWGLRPDLYYVCDSYGLTRVRVCLLYVLLALASAVFLGSESLGT